MDYEKEILALKEEDAKIKNQIQNNQNSINHIYKVLDKIITNAHQENQLIWRIIQKIKKWLCF